MVVLAATVVFVLSEGTVSETTLEYPVAVRRLRPVDIHVSLSDSIRWS